MDKVEYVIRRGPSFRETTTAKHQDECVVIWIAKNEEESEGEWIRLYLYPSAMSAIVRSSDIAFDEALGFPPEEFLAYTTVGGSYDWDTRTGRIWFS